MIDEPNERMGRETVVEMLQSDESLARCLGGVISLLLLCGSNNERRMARAADDAIKNLFRPN